MLKKAGFEILEVSTPGNLDWNIVEGMIKKEGADLGRFWDFFAREAGEGAKKELQGWITKNNLSSHMRVLARRSCSE